MAKKAALKSTSDEIWFNDAVMLLAERLVGSAAGAEQFLVKGLKDGAPSSHMREDGSRVPIDAAFWNQLWLTIIRAENRAFVSAPMPAITPAPPDMPESVVAIKVSQKAVLELLPGLKRKPGPGREKEYDYDAFVDAAKAVLARGKPDTKALFFEQTYNELKLRKGIKLPPDPEDDDSTLRRIVGHLYDAES